RQQQHLHPGGREGIHGDGGARRGVRGDGGRRGVAERRGRRGHRPDAAVRPLDHHSEIRMTPTMSNAIVAQLQQQHTITALVENHPGVLARVAGLFARRGYNIESLSVSITDRPEISRMTIVVGGDHRVLEQITKQLNKLVEVMKVVDYTETAAVERELALIKVNAEPKDRG